MNENRRKIRLSLCCLIRLHYICKIPPLSICTLRAKHLKSAVRWPDESVCDDWHKAQRDGYLVIEIWCTTEALVVKPSKFWGITEPTPCCPSTGSLISMICAAWKGSPLHSKMDDANIAQH